jgi:glycosyltransferase involved in cell wall biosynthesis
LKSLRIVHMSSAHPDKDVRIFSKECVSLANHFHPEGQDVEVHLILSNVEERIEQGIRIHNVAAAKGRLGRMWTTVNKVCKKALELDGDIYHFHDPELLRIALKLKRRGKIVIYDAHEDLPRQLLGKPYLRFRRLFSFFFEIYENFIVKRLDAVVTATPFIRDRFKSIHRLSIDINNYPLEGEIETFVGDTEKDNCVCFIGGISEIRGTIQVVQALDIVDVQLDLAGGIPPAFREQLTKEKGWEKVNELGFIDRKTSLEVKKRAFAGIVTFLPLPNHINAQPNKIFEYMASGLPVIGSDFPLWREILVKNNCGICVDPTSPLDIAKAIRYLQENPEEARIMGENGRKMVAETYNWRAEEKKLFALYEKLIPGK